MIKNIKCTWNKIILFLTFSLSECEDGKCKCKK